ncbi:MAG: SDR family oxidoreductase [Prevotellaceae bacterium]|jgi:short-subunit dehydrogenase|nr:SDR family oxidoreductase [Prevotellaceae bacterium]
MNNVALITGASGGIGLEIAKLFADDNIDLLLVARTEDKLLKIKKQLETQHQIKVYYVPADLSVLSGIKTIEKYVQDNSLQVDFLVNNAGFGDYGNFYDCNIEKNREMIALNVGAAVEFNHIFLKKMVERGRGRVLNVASIAGLLPVPTMSIYGATKAFVLSFSEALWQELKGSGVTVTALLPGPVATNFFDRANAQKVKMFSSTMPADKVAECGYRAMMKGKRRVIAGFSNRALDFAMKLVPKCLALNMTADLMKEN